MSTIVSIEGNIGSGKSTLIQKLREYNSNGPILFLDEPVKEWMDIQDEHGEDILSKFYQDQQTFSFPFQMMAYISRLNKLKNAMKSNQNVIFTERSLTTDKHVFAKMLYDDGKMNTFEYQIYNKWFDAFNKETEISHIVYVNTDPKVCHERIEKRSRKGENNISQEYLTSCHQYHDEMIRLMKTKNIPVLVLDGNQNVFDENTLQSWIYEINRFTNKTIDTENATDSDLKFYSDYM